MAYDTLDPANQLSFVCPIFDSTTTMRSCVKVRTHYALGQRLPVRRGCQACMDAGKCPAAAIIKRIAFSNHYDPDLEFASGEPVVAKLSAQVLSRLEPIVVPLTTIQRYECSQAERDLIESSSVRIAAQLGTAPTKLRRQSRVQPTPAPSVTPAVRSTDVIAEAAARGDLGAAL